MKVIQQFVKDVDWGELDYFLVDLPPGTGDAQLSLAQTVHIRAAIIVTTPQEVAVGDSLRGAKMFERSASRCWRGREHELLRVPALRRATEIFLAGGGTRLADELGVPLLGQVPPAARLPDLCRHGPTGRRGRSRLAGRTGPRGCRPAGQRRRGPLPR